jgi:hypothetical protein
MRLNGFRDAEQLRFFILRDNVGQSSDLPLYDPHIYYGEGIESDVLYIKSAIWSKQQFKLTHLCFPKALKHVVICNKVKHQL